jgi:hypothetical protein
MPRATTELASGWIKVCERTVNGITYAPCFFNPDTKQMSAMRVIEVEEFDEDGCPIPPNGLMIKSIQPAKVSRPKTRDEAVLEIVESESEEAESDDSDSESDSEEAGSESESESESEAASDDEAVSEKSGGTKRSLEEDEAEDEPEIKSNKTNEYELERERRIAFNQMRMREMITARLGSPPPEDSQVSEDDIAKLGRELFGDV